ncbi:MAG: ATP-dependent DNA helicase, partial [bacterium]
MKTIDNPQLELAFNFVQYTNKSVFLTGKAGTGKTTFLHNLKRLSPKRMIVVAPTGVAAINAGGVTIHSFFQMPLGPQVPARYTNETDTSQPYAQNQYNIKKLNREKIGIIKSMDLLVIDEISMVRADLLDGIDDVLRRFRDHDKPFGGTQLLMIGDIQQLAPVVKEDEWEILKSYYETVYFFSSKALNQTHFISIELKHIYRQSDEYFVNILNKIRNNNIDKPALDELNKRYIPNFSPAENEGYITLTTHNRRAQEINDTRLKKLPGKPRVFTAVVEGDFPDYSYPTEYNLELKTGAQVMFVKNDTSGNKLYYNGKIGKIAKIEEDSVWVECPGDPLPIPVEKI